MIFDTLFNMIDYYQNTMTDNTNMSVSNVIHSETMYFHIYKLPDNFIFTSNNDVSSLLSLCNVDDTYTQLIIGKNITIQSNVTLTPPHRCKGLIIYDQGKLINNGVISMTARGCKAIGQDIYLLRDQMIPANGGAGGNSITATARSVGYNGNPGTNGSNRGSGGGGGGALRKGDDTGRATSGAGAQGTCYSGGAGGGAAGCTAGSATGGTGGANGGAGGNGHANSGSTSSSYAPHSHGGGAGNPGGSGSVYRTGQGVGTASKGDDGTGGLIIIFAKTFENNNQIISNGSNGGSASGGYNCGGGASGGGSINIFYNTLNNKGTILSTGGSGGTGGHGTGGKGGDGSITLTPFQYNYTFRIYKQNLLLQDIYTEDIHIGLLYYPEEFLNNHSYTGFSYNKHTIEYNGQDAIVNTYYNRNSYSLTIQNGTSAKYIYLYEETGDIHYNRTNGLNNFLLKFKNWASDYQTEIFLPYLKDTTFKMPAHNITIYAELTDQDRVNTNIYKNIFDNFLFDLYNFQTILNGPYKQETTIFQYNHGFQVYDLLRLNQNGLYEKGIATESKYDVIGMVTEVLNDHEFVLTTYGQIKTNISFDSDSGILYLSDTQEGKFCSYEELVSNFYTPIGFYTGNTITLNILDSSVGEVLKKYHDTIYEYEQSLPYITEAEKQDIIQEVLNNA